MAGDYEKRIAGEFACIDFSALEKAASEGRPEKFRNLDFMVTGPFVVQTQGAFETEYLYEREKILEPDYLVGFGGEKNVAPFYGLQGENRYLGCDVAVWTKGIYKWNTLLFEDEDSDVTCGGALYLTEQRNCISYAAVALIRAVNTRKFVRFSLHGVRLALNIAILCAETVCILLIGKYVFWIGAGYVLILLLVNAKPFIEALRYFLGAVLKKTKKKEKV